MPTGDHNSFDGEGGGHNGERSGQGPLSPCLRVSDAAAATRASSRQASRLPFKWREGAKRQKAELCVRVPPGNALSVPNVTQGNNNRVSLWRWIIPLHSNAFTRARDADRGSSTTKETDTAKL